jgi:PIN domain nuclease of toxin-antitoxin system
MTSGDRRLQKQVRAAVADPQVSLHVSVVTAYEYSDLLARRRLPVLATIDDLVERFDICLETLPIDCWRVAAELPHIHGDPVDRMAVAHAIIGGFTLATADAHMRQYPVPLL